MKTKENKTKVEVKTVEAEPSKIKEILGKLDKEERETLLVLLRDTDSCLDTALPDRERKFEERSETDRLFDKILNDILGDMSNVQLEAIIEEVMAADDYTKAFVLAVTNPELASKVHTELPDFAPIEAFLDSMTDREKVLFVLCQGLYVSGSNSNNSASKYLTGLWERIDDVCNRDIKGMFDDPDFGNMALTGHLLVTVNRG